MIAKIHSAIPFGYEGRLIEVEASLSRGLPAFNIVGMAGKTVSEARERVRTAISTSGLPFPDGRVTINLAPADLLKDGVFLDLPIALSVLILSKKLLPSELTGSLFVGELSLDGQLRPISGIINVVQLAKEQGYKRVFIPEQNLPQASLVPGINLVGVRTLEQLFLHLRQIAPIRGNQTVVKNTNTSVNDQITFNDIRGQTLAKRALEIAVAGHHNLLISGPPGAGKTLLAKAALSLLPDLTPDEQIEATKIYSLSGITDQIISRRPFRTPHHTSSLASLIGGGPKALPGEISLAHQGILFLDELPEYRRDHLEALRQPLEDRQISISRAGHRSSYPANFMLIATMNPCPCGYYGDPTHECTCSPSQIERYQKKLSGPLLDRIDLRLSVKKVPTADLSAPTKTSSYTVVKNNITEAIAHQLSRSGRFNSTLSSSEAANLTINPAAKQLLQTAAEKLSLSARSYFKILKLARTIADLAAADQITAEHISEALTYRQ